MRGGSSGAAPFLFEHAPFRRKREWGEKKKRGRRGPATAIELDPMTFLARLAALIPRPGVHLLTYHGLLAPAGTWAG